jgi:hypothetical protein
MNRNVPRLVTVAIIEYAKRVAGRGKMMGLKAAKHRDFAERHPNKSPLF